MRRFSLPAIFTGLLLLAGQPSTAMANITVNEVIKMANIGVSDSVIITAIEASGTAFQLSPAEIQELKDAGVSQTIIDAMGGSASTTGGESPAAAPQNAPTTQGQSAPSVTGQGQQQAPSVAPQTTSPSTPSQVVLDPSTLQPLPAAIKEVEKKYKAGKFTSAAVEGYELLIGPNKEKYADWRPEIYYWLAKSLLKLGYVHSAHDLMMAVANAGPGHRDFFNSLIYLTLTSRKLNDYDGLKAVMAETEPDNVPAKAKNAYFYLHGLSKYDNEDFADAIEYLERVNSRSEFYIKSLYLQGLIRYRQGDNTRAASIFREIIEADNVRGDAQDILNLQEQSLLNMARIYYRVEDFTQAIDVYNLMPSDSAYWPRALFESAYSNFWKQDYNYALGQILTLYSPFYGDRLFMPGVTILESLIYFNLCEYDRVIQILDTFQARWIPVRDDIRQFVEKYKESPQDAYLAVYGKETEELPPAVIQELYFDTDFQSIRRHIQMIEAEMKVLSQERAQWKNSPLGKQLTQLMKEDIVKLQTRGGERLLALVASYDTRVSNLIGESDIIEFEVLSAQKDTFEEKFKNPEFVETYASLEYNYATEARFIYWPFTGEFWKDELGYYRFTEGGACKR